MRDVLVTVGAIALLVSLAYLIMLGAVLFGPDMDTSDIDLNGKRIKK